jgi:lactate dehydrogenase-like 2-hydroxyacid dehydrogenase
MTRSNQSNNLRVLVVDSELYTSIPEVNAQFENVELVCPQDPSELNEVTHGSFEGVIVKQAPLNGVLLDSLQGVRALVKMGRNYSNVDVVAVRKNKIQFGSAPRKGPNAVAELAMTLILSLSKDLIVNHDSVVSGAYRLRGIKPQLTDQWKFAFHWMKNDRVHEVRGKTLGIFGMGEVGCELALRAHVMGMNILYNKRNKFSVELEERFQAEYRTLEDLLKESDYICLTVPLTGETDKLIGRAQFEMMKETAYLVNVCRGGVVDEGAMIDVLSENRIAGAGLDVFEYEPLPADSPLCYLDNVIMMPHIGGGTGTNKVLELSEAVQEISRILAGEQPKNNLNILP